MVKLANLVLHCGANLAERGQVNESVTPDSTDSWHPIPHRSLVDMLIEGLPAYNMRVVNESHALYKDSDRYFGMFQIAGNDGTQDEAKEDFGLVFGLRNSHDKTFPAGICVGSNVFVCDNLAFSSEIVIGRRHTKNIMRDLPLLMSTAMGKLVQSRIDQTNRLDTYKQTEITDKQADHLIMEAYRQGALKPTRIPKVWDQWARPNHPEFSEKNAWRLFNGFTEVYKQTSLTELPQRTSRLHGILDTACGLVLDAKASVKEAFANNEDILVN